jgi:Site-specific recombinase XerD
MEVFWTMDVEHIRQYRAYLVENERSALTIEKYVRDVTAFYNACGSLPIERELVIAYKTQLAASYAPASVNSMLAALNGFFEFCGYPQFKLKPLKIQRQLFASEGKELNEKEYKKLVMTAKENGNHRLSLIMQTICATGIRVSELCFVTVEAVKLGRAEVSCKNKRRTILLRPELRQVLRQYAKEHGITEGSLFLSRQGNPVNRHAIWSEMKALCQRAGVEATKVFPHNLRHLFARTFYAMKQDLSRLADILGHSNINTTRIYTMEYGHEHMRLLNRMPLLI